MVQRIVIPHDPARSPRLRHLATASEFQAAVHGWLEPIEMPAFARFENVFDAATWCMLLVNTMRPGAFIRLKSRAPVAEEFDESVREGDAPW